MGAVAISDAAINVAPGPSVMVDIVNNAVELLHALGVAEPKVAVLSATESPIAAMPSSLEAAEVVRRAAQGEVANAVIDGPFALDVAVSPQAAAIKGVDSPVAGRADLLIMPNIEAGNAVFKAMVYFMSATAAGLVMGAKVPIMLTSRADPARGAPHRRCPRRHRRPASGARLTPPRWRTSPIVCYGYFPVQPATELTRRRSFRGSET